ncbi:hypothetical protein ACJIZ3_007751 [Penstemon smallii]|uniref:Uncharacterized protein n=1 Tax=Penstemon smallii TaxID=265156 RepID=A0ABD3T7U2_9LAMI
MEERCSVNSPRRILSFSRNRRANVSFSDSDDRSPTTSLEHGPKLSEVYGFVGSITTVVATVFLVIFNSCFHYMGVRSRQLVALYRDILLPKQVLGISCANLCNGDNSTCNWILYRP